MNKLLNSSRISMKNGIFGWVYIIENKINGLCNVGQTINYERRMKQHLYTKEGNKDHSYFDRAYQKYSPNTFWHWKFPCKSQKEMNEWEDYWIKVLNSIEHGYNLKTGGNRNFEMSEKTKEKMRINNLGKNNPNYGNHWTEEQKKEASEKLKKVVRKGTNHPNWGKPRLEDVKDKIRKSKIGKKRTIGSRILQSESMKQFYLTLEGDKKRKEDSELMKGRFTGKDNPNAKLTERIVTEIRKDLKMGLFSQTELAKKYNISQNVVSCINTNKIWKNILEE